MLYQRLYVYHLSLGVAAVTLCYIPVVTNHYGGEVTCCTAGEPCSQNLREHFGEPVSMTSLVSKLMKSGEYVWRPELCCIENRAMWIGNKMLHLKTASV